MEEEGKSKRQIENQYLKKEHSQICDPLIFGISYEEMIISTSFFFLNFGSLQHYIFLGTQGRDAHGWGNE